MTVAETGSMLEITLALVAPMRRMPFKIEAVRQHRAEDYYAAESAEKLEARPRIYLPRTEYGQQHKPAEQHSPAEHGGRVVFPDQRNGYQRIANEEHPRRKPPQQSGEREGEPADVAARCNEECAADRKQDGYCLRRGRLFLPFTQV